MERSDIARTIDEIDALRRDTRRALRSFWFPLVLFGALTLVGGIACLMGDGGAIGIYWAVAGPAGGIATGVHYARREAATGVSRPAAPYVVVAVGILAGAFILPALTSGDLQEVVSNFAVAAGYLAFAWIERDWRIAAIAVLLAAVPLATLALVPGSACVVTAAVTGTVVLASGVAFRRADAAHVRATR